MHVCSCVLHPACLSQVGSGLLSLVLCLLLFLWLRASWRPVRSSLGRLPPSFAWQCCTPLGSVAWLTERHWVISTLLHFKIVATNSLVAVLFVSGYLGRWNSTKSKYVCNFKWYTKFSLLLFSRNPTILACISPFVQVFLKEQILTFNCWIVWRD